jgi:adenylate cyclase
MAEERVQRRITTILAADVVGYSRLMERDEDGTLAALKARRRELLEPLVSQHQGRVFKVTGDGVLIEFGSAVNAVRCAVDLQHGMAEANAGLPEDRHVVLRIGVNLGDVMVEGGDRYGDGVNIAARLEQLAEPGGILVSGTTYDHARNKVKAGFEDLGTQTLKNIAEPVRAYRVAGLPTVAVSAPKPTTAKPSIAVLPFVNMSGDPEQEYFSDGITEDLITELSRFRELSVVSRSSSFVFKGRNATITEVSEKLKAQYLVEGSIRKAGNRVRVTAQLIDANTDQHIWADRYDRQLEDIFEVQDDIVHRVASTLVARLEHQRQERARRRSKSELRAYDLYLRGREHFFSWSLDDNLKARDLLRLAIDTEPEYAAALALLSEVQLRMWLNGWSDHPNDDLAESFAAAQKAVEIDDQDSRTHTALGLASLSTAT